MDEIITALPDPLEASILILEVLKETGNTRCAFEMVAYLTPQPGNLFKVFVQRIRRNSQITKIQMADPDYALDS